MQQPTPQQNELIAKRAYDIYMARGGNHGADFDDWLQAEHEVVSLGAKPAKKSAPKTVRKTKRTTK